MNRIIYMTKTCLLLACLLQTVLTMNQELCVYKAIFSNYSSEIRPVHFPNETINVNIQLALNSLQNIDELNEVMEIVGFFRTRWTDKTLTWNPAEYGDVNHIVVHAQKVWLPDIALSNSASLFYYETHKKDFRVRISSNGTVEWSFGGIFSTSCDMQLKQYPFDIQVCNITIDSWLYTTQEVNIMYDLESGGIEIVDDIINSLWSLKSYKAYSEIKYREFSSVSFSFTWERKSLYYVTNIILPTLLIVIATFGVHWLPAECGEKVSLAITVLLALTVFQIVVLESTPVNSDVVSILILYILGMMFLSTFTLGTAIFVVWISGREHYRRAPSWLRTLCFNYLQKIVCLHFATDNGVDHAEEKEESRKRTYAETVSALTQGSDDSKADNHDVIHVDVHARGDHTVKDLLGQLLIAIRSSSGENELFEEWQKEWKHIGRIIDRTMFYFSVLIFVIINIAVFAQAG